MSNISNISQFDLDNKIEATNKELTNIKVKMNEITQISKKIAILKSE